VPEQLTATRPRAVRVGRVARLAAAVLALTAAGAGPALAAAAGPAHAAVRQGPVAPAGPAPISPLGHPRLCWEAWGNGTPVTLESCERALQGQQWTFTGHVLMNGNGYCLQNGGAAAAGMKPAQLYLSFSGQCGGAPTQLWSLAGLAGQVRNGKAGLCAYARGGLVPGAVIVGLRCGSGPGWDTWSQGTSAVKLSAATPSSTPTGHVAASGQRAFSGQLTLSNGLRAMTAYGVSVSVRAPRGLHVTRLTAAGGLAGWTCTARALDCRGNLAGGGRGEITMAGTVASSVTGRAAADAITVRAAVTRTNQSRRRLTARVPVRVYTAAAGTAGQDTGHGSGSNHVVTFAVIAAVVLLIAGTALAVVTRRRPGPPVMPAAYPDGGAAAAGQQGAPTAGQQGVPAAGQQGVPAAGQQGAPAAGQQVGQAAAGRQARLAAAGGQATPASAPSGAAAAALAGGPRRRDVRPAQGPHGFGRSRPSRRRAS
jgi:hypothetical protein